MFSKSVLILPQEDTSYHLCSPAVGIFTPQVEDGFPLHNRTVLGTLDILGQKSSLVLPAGFQGKILHTQVKKNQALHYGTILFLATLTGAQKTQLQNQKEGMLLISSPMAGVFYRRGAPNQPCFVNEGDIVRLGTTLGLVEQMKSFNRISFHGEGHLTSGKIVQILVEDQSEVEPGTPLFSIEPIHEGA